MDRPGENGFEDPLLRRVAEFLDERFGLETLWLFGSEAQGRATPLSDVDVAVLLTKRPPAEEWLQTLGDVDGLYGKHVDLVDLERASPILAMQVLRHGRLLEDKNPSRRIAFTCKTLSMYEDLKIFRRPMEEALLARYRDG